MLKRCAMMEKVKKIYLNDIDDSITTMTLDEMLLMIQLDTIIFKTCGSDAKIMIRKITNGIIKVDVKPSPKTGINNLMAETIDTDIFAIVIPNIEYSIRFLIKRKRK